tara:strand:+ start:21959 stop:22267 length:309 start_codon:yes stop_codon:yes gene_type:complete
MTHLSESITIWYLSGDNTGRGPKFLNPVYGMSTKQVSVALTQSEAGKDYNNTTVIQCDVKPENGAYIATGTHAGQLPGDEALQIKRFVQDYFNEKLWEVHLG